jgi:hypothetical protein
MPLQNRVDPFGQIHAVPQRGLFTGNRGIIHDPATKTLLSRRWTLKAWIVCRCAFKGVRREPMGRNRKGGPGEPDRPGWTELFFLDEVTALAAGHRPCFYCRREQARDFCRRFGAAFDIETPRAPMLDLRLHQERLASGGAPVAIAGEALASLPDATMFADGDAAYALRQGTALRWSFAGYGERVSSRSFAGRRLHLLTPPTTIAVLRHGFCPIWHPTAGS